MGLSKTQMDNLLENVQYFLDNPVKQVDWEKISQQFSRLLKQDIEYDEEEIQYALRKLKLPDGVDVSSLYVIADGLLMNYKHDKGLRSQMDDLEKDNRELVSFLRKLRFPTVNNPILSYETDHWFLMNGFEEILRKGVEYNMDDIRNWLYVNKSDNLLQDNVIEEITKIAEFTQLYFKKPKKNN